MRRVLSVVAAVVLAAALVGCSTEDDSGLPRFGEQRATPSSVPSTPTAAPTAAAPRTAAPTTAAPTAAAPATAAPTTAAPTAPASTGPAPAPSTIPATIGSELPGRGTRLGDPANAITVGRTVRGGGTTEAVQVAYVAFWIERARAMRRAVADLAAIATVATGDAAQRIVASVRELRAERRHTEGGSTVNVVAVRPGGTSATVTDCLADRSTDRDASGKAVETAATAPVPLVATLVRARGTWRVSRVVDGRASDCS